MKIFAATLAIFVACFAAPSSRAVVLDAIPGLNEQGPMIMPMISLSGTTLSVMFMQSSVPELGSVDHWVPGGTFEPTAAWYSQLDPVGGAGKLFNNQYGFMFMMEGDELFPVGKTIGIRLTAVSSEFLQAWNYGISANRFDEIFQEVGDQVLWNGDMWHNYFTMPADAVPGTYTASFEVFITDTPFTTGTGVADYSQSAQSAVASSGYNTVSFTYSWEVIPEPSTYLLLAAAAGLFFMLRLRKPAQA